MNNILIIKALQSYRKKKADNLKNAIKYERTNIAHRRFNEICEIDNLILKLETLPL